MRTSKIFSQVENKQKSEKKRKDGKKSERLVAILVVVGIVVFYTAIYLLTDHFFSEEVVKGVMFVTLIAPVLVFMLLETTPCNSPRDEKLSEEEREKAKKEWREWRRTMLVGLGMLVFLMAVGFLLAHFFSEEVAVTVVVSMVFVPILAFFILQAIEIIKK